MTATERRAPSCAPPCTLTPTSRTDQGEAEPAQADSAGYRTQDPGRPAPVSLESWSDRMPTASALIPVLLAAGLPPALRVEITSPKTRLSVFEPVKLTARVTANKTVTVPPMSDTPRDWRRRRLERLLTAGSGLVKTVVLVEGRIGERPPAPFPANGRYDACDPALDMEGADYGTDDRQFEVRSERKGTSSSGRTYTIKYSAEDASGNKGTATTTVTVRHDQGKK